MRITYFTHLVLLAVLSACSGQNAAGVDAGAQVGGTGGVENTSPGGHSNSGGTASSSAGNGNVGGRTSTGGTTSTSTTTQGSVILYGTPYTNVNMWYGPVDFAESQWHNACGLEDGTKYPTVIQNLYGNYIIGLDGDNIPNVESHCDDCAQLTANGKTIIAHIVTYGTENGVDAIDLSPEAQSALGLSSSNWTGTWQFCSCPTNGTPIYYEFDSRQWTPQQNFWYMRIWTRNQRLPVTRNETWQRGLVRSLAGERRCLGDAKRRRFLGWLSGARDRRRQPTTYRHNSRTDRAQPREPNRRAREFSIIARAISGAHKRAPSLSCMRPFPSNLSTIMSANGCFNVPINSVAYCCPAAILTTCR